MSFSREIKDEIMSQPIEDDGCLSFLCGLVMSIGKLIDGKIQLVTDIYELFDYTNKILKRLYGQNAEITIFESSTINKTEYYNIDFDQALTQKIVNDLNLYDENHNVCLDIDLDRHLVNTEEGLCSFVKAITIACSTSAIKLSSAPNEKTYSGYHLEWTNKNYDLLVTLSTLLNHYAIFPKLIERKNTFVLYLKEAQAISDVFALVGAYQAVLSLQNEMATREVRNSVNRQTNCMNANISKTVSANMKQLEAIEIISSTIGLENLPPQLEEACLLRLANTEESLSELVSLSGNTLSKSGLNHRFNKIMKLAKELKD